ncbi:hypothetical protein RFI_40284 [Reticulomyxa filosa]|uniref:Uncharacterized protein n=1 Tax=Reticulomyxa filosa TaxID=46433 RepID=X6L6Z7_RETFI|nr:hypothetical protein RFI_40284 [Reticulomyxa filosa]|eukprot:ETN97247.1 hypothetical protein RFI_40284 [Reticulomyxa filosa]
MCKKHENASEVVHATTNLQIQDSLEGNANEEQSASEKERMIQCPIKRAPSNITTNEVVLDYFNLREINGGRLLDIIGTKKGCMINFDSFIIGLAQTKQYNGGALGEVDKLIKIYRHCTQELTSKKNLGAGCWHNIKNDIIFRSITMADLNKWNMLRLLKIWQSVDQLVENATDKSGKETSQKKFFVMGYSQPRRNENIGNGILQTNMGEMSEISKKKQCKIISSGNWNAWILLIALLM